MAFVSISGFKYHDADSSSRRAAPDQGQQPDVVLVLDVSGNTSSSFIGSTMIGDLNQDGYSNTILDAEISAAGSSSSLLAQGLGAAISSGLLRRLRLHRILGTVDQKSAYSSGYAFYDAAKSLYDGGMTNFTDALLEAEVSRSLGINTRQHHLPLRRFTQQRRISSPRTDASG